MSLNQQSKSRSSSYLARTQGFLRTQLWVWPLVAAVVLAFVAVTLRLKVEGALKQQIASNLQVILNANAEALRAWSTTMKSDAQSLAEDERVRELVTALLQIKIEPGQSAQIQLLSSPEPASLRTELDPWLDRQGFSGFVLVDTNYMIRAAQHDEIVGMASPPGYRGVFFQLLRRRGCGHPAVSQSGDAAGCERQIACRRADDVRRRAHQIGGWQSHRRARPAHRAGKRFHAHPRHGTRRRDRRDVCLLAQRAAVVQQPLRRRAAAAWLDSRLRTTPTRFSPWNCATRWWI